MDEGEKTKGGGMRRAIIYDHIKARIRELPEGIREKMYYAAMVYAEEETDTDFKDIGLNFGWELVKYAIDHSASKCKQMSETAKKRWENSSGKDIISNAYALPTQCDSNTPANAYVVKNKNKNKKPPISPPTGDGGVVSFFSEEGEASPNSVVTPKPVESTDKASRAEFEEYLGRYNQLFSSKAKPLPKRFEKFGARRKVFSQEEMLRSLEAMANNPFYQGQNDRGWVADFDFHIRADEKVSKFLETSFVEPPPKNEAEMHERNIKRIYSQEGKTRVQIIEEYAEYCLENGL